jgi:hypothetical protein
LLSLLGQLEGAKLNGVKEVVIDVSELANILLSFRNRMKELRGYVERERHRTP